MAEDLEGASLGEYLRDARIKAGVSIRQLAPRVGVSIGHLSRIENGGRGNPKVELLKRIATELGIDTREVFKRIGIEQAALEPKTYFREHLGLNSDESEILLGLAEEIKNKRKENNEETN